MSHEILLVAGSAALGATRREAIDRAALELPGFLSHESGVRGTTAVSLVEAAPSGGDVAAMTTEADGLRLVVGTGVEPRGRDVRESGAEAAAVEVLVAEDGRTRVRTDGAGLLPCFWSGSATGLTVSTHLASMVSLGISPDLDDTAVLQYLVLLHPLDDRTLLRGVRLLPPGCELTWVLGQEPTVTSRSLMVPGGEPLSDDQVVARFAALWPEVVQQALERSPGQRPLVGLSGGLDSRAIAAAASQLGRRPLAYTYGTRVNREVRTAERVAQQLGWPHLVLPVTPDRRLHGVVETALRLDGAHSPSEMYESWFAGTLREHGDTIVNGLAGGPLWGDDKAHGLMDLESVVEFQLARYTGAAASLRPYLWGAAASGLDHELRRSLRSSLEPWDMGAREDAPGLWKLHNRQLRWGNMLFSSLRREGLRPEAPFLDSRVLRLTAGLTPEQHKNGSLYLRVHREALPETSNIPRTDDGNSPNRLTHVYWSSDRSFARQLADLGRSHPVSAGRRVYRRAHDVVMGRASAKHPGSTRLARAASAADVFPADIWVRGGGTYPQRLASMLRSGDFSGTPVAPEAVDQACDALEAGRVEGSAGTLGKVAALGTWVADYRRRAKPAG